MGTMTQLREIGLAVKDLDESIAWFQKVFGASVVREINELPAEKTRTCFVKAGGITYELMADMDGTGPIARFVEKRGEGIHALHTKVDNLEETVKGLKAKGVIIAGQAPLTFVHPKSTMGVMWELIQDDGKPWPSKEDESWPGTEMELMYIGIAVQNLEDAVRLYRDVLGGQLVKSGEIPGENTMNAVFRLCGVTVELMASMSPGDAISTFIAKKGEGVYAVRYNVPDLAKTLAHIESVGIRIGARRADEYAYLSPRDCHGVLFLIGQL